MGATLFVIGLAKKTLIADNLSVLSNSVFNLSDFSQVGFVDSWLGALCYTFQLYFDFSAYSDMAMGISIMIGIALPANFLSPYKSHNIITFWRTWHITLSTFLRNYVYIPLGGSRRGEVRRFVNLAATMLIGGIWHGANITFIIWGSLHALYLIANHAWVAICSRFGISVPASLRPVTLFFSICLTFLLVVVAWVFFRADTLGQALEIVHRMFGLGGGELGLTTRFGSVLADENLPVLTWLGKLLGCVDFLLLGLAGVIVFFTPNAVHIAERLQAALDVQAGEGRLRFVALAGMAGLAFLFLLSLISFRSESPFLYFQF